MVESQYYLLVRLKKGEMCVHISSLDTHTFRLTYQALTVAKTILTTSSCMWRTRQSTTPSGLRRWRNVFLIGVGAIRGDYDGGAGLDAFKGRCR